MFLTPFCHLSNWILKYIPYDPCMVYFSYIWLHLVDFYGKCRYIYIYHTWILWVWVSSSSFYPEVKRQKHGKICHYYCLLNFPCHVSGCQWNFHECWGLNFNQIILNTVEIEIKWRSPSWSSWKKKLNKTRNQGVLWRQTSSFQPGRINGNCLNPDTSLRDWHIYLHEIPSKISHLLVGGFNPIEKYSSNWESSPNRDEHKKCLKPPPSLYR